MCAAGTVVALPRREGIDTESASWPSRYARSRWAEIEPEASASNWVANKYSSAEVDISVSVIASAPRKSPCAAWCAATRPWVWVCNKSTQVSPAPRYDAAHHRARTKVATSTADGTATGGMAPPLPPPPLLLLSRQAVVLSWPLIGRLWYSEEPARRLEADTGEMRWRVRATEFGDNCSLSTCSLLLL